MKKYIVSTVIFLLGATAGVALSNLYYKKKYEEMVAEEIESVKSHVNIYKEKIDSLEDNNSDLKRRMRLNHDVRVREVKDYSDINKGNGYGEPSPPEDPPDYPYIVNEEVFMHEDDFDKISLTYYEPDDQLTDEADELIPDIENYICIDFAEHFGNCDHGDPDVIYVRNEKCHTDFEVTRMHMSYAEMMGVE